MRTGWASAVLAAVSIAACENGAGSQAPADSGVPPQGAVRFLVTVALAGGGSGTVTSSDGAISCGGRCSASLDRGARVSLQAQAASGSRFTGWQGACSGNAVCDLTLDADKAVTAVFDVDAPPPPGKHRLSVTRAGDGAGDVRSAPPGIDCGTTCSADFGQGVRATLTATPASGSRFTGWSGGCTGTGECSVAMSEDRAVNATFAKEGPPPPPADECAGLLPAPASPVTFQTTGSFCLQSDGDDNSGSGNLALGYEVQDGPYFPRVSFVTIRNGQAVETAATGSGDDQSSLRVFSQPSGFTTETGHSNGFVDLAFFDHEGRLGNVYRTVNDYSEGEPVNVVDPSGGMVVIRTRKDVPGNRFTFVRLDKSGNVEVAEKAIAGGNAGIFRVAVTLTGNVVVLARPADGSAPVAKWLSRSGAELTGWFPAGLDRNTESGNFDLAAGSGALWFDNRNVVYARSFPDGEARTEAAPQWLQDRKGAYRAELVRQGKAYAVFNSPQCAQSAFEVVAAASGKSCGCAEAGMASPWAGTVGRDGTLIVPVVTLLGDGRGNSCSYRLYPQLLK